MAQTDTMLAPDFVDERLTDEIAYPESDGEPMADNTLQFQWIVTIEGGLDLLFKDDPNVFVAGDLFWYPVEGDNKTRVAPDAMVVFGRPKGHRGSYRQWVEDDIAPQVVFEVLSPGNTPMEMLRKLNFYERYGVEEYYVYDPYRNELQGWMRQESGLQAIAEERFTTGDGWNSPRLGVSIRLDEETLTFIRPDGQPFESYVELGTRLEQEQKRAEQERERAERLAAQLRALGVEPEAGDNS